MARHYVKRLFCRTMPSITASAFLSHRTKVAQYFNLTIVSFRRSLIPWKTYCLRSGMQQRLCDIRTTTVATQPPFPQPTNISAVQHFIYQATSLLPIPSTNPFNTQTPEHFTLISTTENPSKVSVLPILEPKHQAPCHTTILRKGPRHLST